VTPIETPKQDSLSWVVFSEDDRPGCIVEECDNEAIRKLGPIGCCNELYPYCVGHFEMHHNWLKEELAIYPLMEHDSCGGTFTDYRVVDL